MFCPRCGTEYLSNCNFCKKCGNKLNEENIPPNNINTYYTVMPNKPVKYDLMAMITALVIFPITIFFRFAFSETVVKYGWRRYTTTVLPEGMKILGIIIVLTLLVTSIIFMVNFAKHNKGRKNKYKVCTIIIDIIAVILSLLCLE